jgi:hypothetical protein
MRTPGEHKGDEDPTDTSFHQKEIKELIDSLLQSFDVLPPRFDRVLFKYIYVYMLDIDSYDG